MKLKMLYNVTQLPSTAMLAGYIETYGYSSYGPVVANDYEVVGNIWFDLNDEDRTDFTELQDLLTSQYDLATYEVI
jgi:hypothetical protein